MSPTRPRPAFIFEDEDIVVIDKPEGLPVIAPDGSRGRSLYDIVTARIQVRNKKGRAAVVHRLDRDTSGIVMFAKNARAKTILMGAWNELVRTRRYVAVAEGAMPAESGVMEDWLLETGAGRVRSVPAGTHGSLRAVTRYRVLSRGESSCLVELELETGRKHQIRAQLAALGHPVAGDGRYGSRTDPAGRLCLHATLLELELPYGAHEVKRFESPVPPCFQAAVRGAGGRTGRVPGDPKGPAGEGRGARLPAGPGARPTRRGDGQRAGADGRSAHGAKPAGGRGRAATPPPVGGAAEPLNPEAGTASARKPRKPRKKAADKSAPPRRKNPPRGTKPKRA